MAFVVIQHLAPTYRSQMVELLATHTTMPISQIEDGVTIQPDHIYVIPPGKWVTTFHGRLFLSDPENRAPILPIDYFFRSLVEDRGELAIGIALSGTGSDATLGVRAIKCDKYCSMMSPIVAYPDLPFSFSAVSHWPFRIGSIINLSRAFAAPITLVCSERWTCERGLQMLTETQGEYSKALPAAAVVPKRISDHEHETRGEHPSRFGEHR